MDKNDFITKVAVYYPEGEVHAQNVLNHISSNGFRALEYITFKEVAEAILLQKCELGIVYCGTDLDMVSKINKMKDVRCVMALNDVTVKQARSMFDANILCITSSLNEEDTVHILNTFLSTRYEADAEKEKYIKLINQLSMDEKLS